MRKAGEDSNSVTSDRLGNHNAAGTGNGVRSGFSHTPKPAMCGESADGAVVESLFEMGAGTWSKSGCIRAAAAANNDREAAIDWCLAHPDEVASGGSAEARELQVEEICPHDSLLYVVVAPRSIDLRQDTGFNQQFILKRLLLQPHCHVFTRGFQHRNHDYWVCPNSTWVTFLGNDEARHHWNGIEEATLDTLADSFRLERQPQ